MDVGFLNFLHLHLQSAAVRWVSCGLNEQPTHSSTRLYHRLQESLARARHSGLAQSPRTQTVSVYLCWRDPYLLVTF